MQIIYNSTNKQTSETNIFGFTVVKFPGTTYCKYYTSTYFHFVLVFCQSLPMHKNLLNNYKQIHMVTLLLLTLDKCLLLIVYDK